METMMRSGVEMKGGVSGRIAEIDRERSDRVRDFAEVERRLGLEELRGQAERCMHCGVPFCHGEGCPLGNEIPNFNEAVAGGRMRDAYRILSRTSLFPEFTARVCPALCEGSCTHGATDEPVMVRQLEKLIIETAFEQGWVELPEPKRASGWSVAVVGSGPAGLAAAETLRRGGARVTVFEQSARPGGLLRYGIPNFKLDKRVIDRRIALLDEAGIEFVCGTEIGRDIAPEYLRRHFDGVLLALGTQAARDLRIPGRELPGIHLALEFLGAQARQAESGGDGPEISAKGKDVLVIGGGDTGSDCVGTAIRQGARSVTQVEIMPKPPVARAADNPWPEWPRVLRTSSSHEEGCARMWNINSVRAIGDGHVEGVEVEDVEWTTGPDGRRTFAPVTGSRRIIPAQLVLLAMGFTGVPEGGVPDALGLARTRRTTLVSSPEAHIFAAGDCATGASLVVRAMAHAIGEARKMLAALD